MTGKQLHQKASSLQEPTDKLSRMAHHDDYYGRHMNGISCSLVNIPSFNHFCPLSLGSAKCFITQMHHRSVHTLQMTAPRYKNNHSNEYKAKERGHNILIITLVEICACCPS